MLEIELNERKRVELAQHYIEKYKLFFVVIDCKNGFKATGILKDISPNNYLIISYNDTFVEIDPLTITNFWGRPDKFATNRGVKNI